MAMEGSTSPGAGSESNLRITILGVDPADPRAVAELPQWVPTPATGLYRVPMLDRRSIQPSGVRTNPPGAARSILQRLRGRRRSISTLADATSAAATECELTVRELEVQEQMPTAQGQTPTAQRHTPAARGPIPAAPERDWWIVGAWAVTALTVGVPLAAFGLLAVASGLLVWILASSLVIGSLSLGTGFALLHEAAAIRRTDASFAAAIARASFEAGGGAHPVVVVPARNAAGVAAALRERRFAADARGPGVAPGAGT